MNKVHLSHKLSKRSRYNLRTHWFRSFSLCLVITQRQKLLLTQYPHLEIPYFLLLPVVTFLFTEKNNRSKYTPKHFEQLEHWFILMFARTKRPFIWTARSASSSALIAFCSFGLECSSFDAPFEDTRAYSYTERVKQLQIILIGNEFISLCSWLKNW